MLRFRMISKHKEEPTRTLEIHLFSLKSTTKRWNAINTVN